MVGAGLKARVCGWVEQELSRNPRPVPLIGNKAKNSRNIATGTVARHGKMISIDPKEVSSSPDVARRRVRLFDGDRIAVFGCTIIIKKDDCRPGSGCQFSDEAIVRTDVPQDPAAAVKIHGRGPQVSSDARINDAKSERMSGELDIHVSDRRIGHGNWPG